MRIGKAGFVHEGREAVRDVSEASRQVITTTSWASVALVAVAAVSVLALGVGLIALHRISVVSRAA